MQTSGKSCVRELLNIKYISVIFLCLLSIYVLILAREPSSLVVRGLFLILFPFSISYLLTPIVCVIALKLEIVDQPDKRKMHKEPTPLLGGGPVFLAFGIGAVSSFWYSPELKGVVYAASIVFIIGLLDDLFDLSSIVRLLAQTSAVFVLIYYGMIIDVVPNITDMHIIGKVITILFVVGVTNAVNFLDGLDGLCVGFGAISSFFFGIIALLTHQYFLMFVAFSLCGSCLGFLPWNFRAHKSARIFLGDAGSLFIGFTLVSFTVMGDWAENRTVALAVPMLILLLPIYDICMTTYFRIKEGSVKSVRQWFDFVGKDHIHHRLCAMGFSKQKAVWILYLFTILLGISAIIIRTGGTLEAYLGLLQASIVLILFTAFMKKVKVTKE